MAVEAFANRKYISKVLLGVSIKLCGVCPHLLLLPMIPIARKFGQKSVLASMGTFVDLTGKIFGCLTVVERGENSKDGATRWLCQCTCGNKNLVWALSLMSSNTKSCGCRGAKIINLNDRFGKLTIVRRIDRRTWECRCDCGTIKPILAKKLRREDGKGTKSCGCSRNWNARKLSIREYARQRLLVRYKRGTRMRGLKWELLDVEFSRMITEKCFYCATPPATEMVRQNEKFLHNGIDRKDSGEGYTPINSVPCCGVCNQMKSDIPFHEFVLHIRKINNNLVLGATSNG